MSNSLSSRKFQLAIAVLFTSFLSVQLIASGVFDGLSSTANSGQSQSERKLEINEKAIPKGIIQILNVKNLESENFPEGFEVEVKNISDKPIYCIHFHARFEESRPFLGVRLMFDLSYGATRLRTTRALAQEGDIPLLPGESVVLKLNPLHVKGILMRARENDGFAAIGRSRVVLMMQHINFGDGAGYMPGGFYPASRLSHGGTPGGCNRGTSETVENGCVGGCSWTNWRTGGGDDPCQSFSDGSFLCEEHLCQSWSVDPCDSGGCAY